jgi:hypothetical protein
VGGTGLSAAVVAHAQQKITNRTVNATGCDIGIYIGQGASHVTVASVFVFGANFEGILAEKTSHVTVKNSTLTKNGNNTIDPSAPALPGNGLHSYVGQSFAISVFGVQYATVQGNTVTANGRGGIGIMDNGPNDPGALTQNTSAPLIGSSHVNVIGNKVWTNAGGCAIVTATQNVGSTLSDLTIRGNVVHGTGMTATGPDIGGIVVAADLPASTVKNVTVQGNTVNNSFEGGVIVNSEAPTSSTRNVTVTKNNLRGNNWGFLEAPNTAGVIVFAADGAQNVGTSVTRNSIDAQFYGVWSTGMNRPHVAQNRIHVTTGGTRVFFG